MGMGWELGREVRVPCLGNWDGMGIWECEDNVPASSSSGISDSDSAQSIYIRPKFLDYTVSIQNSSSNQTKMVITSVAKRVWTGGPYNKNKLMAWWFKFSYNYGWDGRQYGRENA
jgi:hypothetical protein